VLSSQSRIATWLHAPREQHDPLVLELIGPLVGELRQDLRLGAISFGRYSKPDWHLRLEIQGSTEWVHGAIRDLLERRLASAHEQGLLPEFEVAEAAPDLDGYGSEDVLRLAERVSHHDTLACVDLLAAESRGLFDKSRREYCLIMTERYLDLMHLTRDERIAFYRHSYSFEIDLGRWQEDEQRAIERHYCSIKDGLVELFQGETGGRPELLWGGAEPARIARACLEGLASPLEELRKAHAAGTLPRSLGNLAWTLTHMHCNRLQVEADAEAIIRFFMHRLHTEESIVVE
jgi:thiopeptide-type bacteriocin biosynthesis protein